jgi:hypothetical protein
MKLLAVSNLCLNKNCSQTEVFSKSTVKAGIYIWGYMNASGQFIPLYVGKARNIHERIIQHYCRFKGGEYQIPRHIVEDKTNDNTTYKIDYVSVYQPKDFQSVIDLHSDNSNYRNIHEYILNKFRFAYLETKNRKLFEKYLAKKIGHERLITSVPTLCEPEDKDLFKEIDNAFGKYYLIPQ